jgi:hypothetical protein
MIVKLKGMPERQGPYKDSWVSNPPPGFVDEDITMDDPRWHPFTQDTVLSQKERLELLTAAEPGLSDAEILACLLFTGLSENEANLVVLERNSMLNNSTEPTKVY